MRWVWNMVTPEPKAVALTSWYTLGDDARLGAALLDWLLVPPLLFVPRPLDLPLPLATPPPPTAATAAAAADQWPAYTCACASALNS